MDQIFIYDPEDELGWLTLDYEQEIEIDEVTYKSPIHYVLSSIICRSEKTKVMNSGNGIQVRNAFRDSFKRCEKQMIEMMKKRYSENYKIKYMFEEYLTHIRKVLVVKYRNEEMRNKLLSLQVDSIICKDINPFMGTGVYGDNGYNIVGIETLNILKKIRNDINRNIIPLEPDLSKYEWLSPAYEYNFTINDKTFKTFIHFVVYNILLDDVLNLNTSKQVMDHYYKNLSKHMPTLEKKGRQYFPELQEYVRSAEEIGKKHDFVQLIIEKISKDSASLWYKKVSRNKRIPEMTFSISQVEIEKKEDIEYFKYKHKYDPLLILSAEGDNYLSSILKTSRELSFKAEKKSETIEILRDKFLYKIISSISLFFEYLLSDKENFMVLSFVSKTTINFKDRYASKSKTMNVADVQITPEIVAYFLREICVFPSFSSQELLDHGENFSNKVRGYLNSTRAKETIIGEDAISIIYNTIMYLSKCFYSDNEEETKRLITTSEKLYILYDPYDYNPFIEKKELKLKFDREDNFLFRSLIFTMTRLVDYNDLKNIGLKELEFSYGIITGKVNEFNLEKEVENEELLKLFRIVLSEDDIGFKVSSNTLFTSVYFHLHEEMKRDKFLYNRIVGFSRDVK